MTPHNIITDIYPQYLDKFNFCINKENIKCLGIMFIFV